MTDETKRILTEPISNRPYWKPTPNPHEDKEKIARIEAYQREHPMSTEELKARVEKSHARVEKMKHERKTARGGNPPQEFHDTELDAE